MSKFGPIRASGPISFSVIVKKATVLIEVYMINIPSFVRIFAAFLWKFPLIIALNIHTLDTPASLWPLEVLQSSICTDGFND
jgi:hypothetical protein